MEFGKHVCEALRTKGYWADYIDPCSGLPVCSEASMRPTCDLIMIISAISGLNFVSDADSRHNEGLL